MIIFHKTDVLFIIFTFLHIKAFCNLQRDKLAEISRRLSFDKFFQHFVFKLIRHDCRNLKGRAFQTSGYQNKFNNNRVGLMFTDDTGKCPSWL